jgi:F0F1-type ATP synthase membrane subunit b/b'
MGWNMIIQFLILTTVISGAIIFALWLILIKTVDGAKQRLDRDAEAARQREAELNQKIKEADAELQRRKKELDTMEKKMRLELEEQANKHKEELLHKARLEAEEIITKAQNAKEQVRRDIERTMELKIIDYSVKIISDVFSLQIKDSLDKELMKEFIEKLKSVDMGRLGPQLKSADILTANPLPEALLSEVHKIIKDKLGRDIRLDPKIDKTLIGGVSLQFESLLLDGSLQNAFKDAAVALKQQIEKQYTN